VKDTKIGNLYKLEWSTQIISEVVVVSDEANKLLIYGISD
jgi:hypothetical protein